MTSLLTSVSLLFWALYIGPMVGFAVLLTFRKHLNTLTTEDLIRCFQSYGAPFGLSFGTLIFLFVYIRWQQYGEFNLYWSSTADQYQSLAIVIGVIVWMSNLILEVWTLEPLRQLNESTNDPKYQKAFKSFHKHLLFHATILTISSFLYLYGHMEGL